MIRVKIGSVKDLETVWPMCLALQEHYHHQPSNKELKALRANLLKSARKKLLYVARFKLKPIGYLSVELLGKNHHNFPNSVFLSELYVKEKFRKQGVGRKLVRFAFKQRHARDYRYFSVTHASGYTWLTHFYKGFDFRLDGKTESGNIRMIKNCA